MFAPRTILSCLMTALVSAGAAADQPPGTARPVNALQARIDAAAPGQSLTVGPGTYYGPLRIDKALSLIGEGRPVIDGSGNGDVLTITVEGVSVKGFDIRGTGISLDLENCGIRVLAGHATIEDNRLTDVLFGIDLKEAPDSVIRNNRIGGKLLDIARRGDGLRLWRSDRTVVEGNTIHDGRDAILWYSDGVVVRHNRSERCRYGLHLMFSHGATIEDNTLTDNSVGVYLMYSNRLNLCRNLLIRNRGPSGYGLGLKDVDEFRVHDNVFLGNRVGVYIDNSPVTRTIPGDITRNALAGNDIGVSFLPSVKGARVWENSFLDNSEQVCILGRGELTENEFAVAGRGNFWSDYGGYDIDGDGVGEAEYESQKLFESLVDREPKLRLFLYSPVQQAIEFVGRAVPAIQPEARFTDPSPLTAPVPIVVKLEEPSPTVSTWLVPGGLLAVVGSIWTMAGLMPWPDRGGTRVPGAKT